MSVIKNSPTEGESNSTRVPTSGAAQQGGGHLYRLPELDEADHVYVVRGEENVDLFHDLGLFATTSARGSQPVERTDWKPLAGKSVFILPDFGRFGEAYAKAVSGQLATIEPRPQVRVVRLPGMSEGGEFYRQWFKRFEGQTSEQILAELDRIAGQTPPEDEVADDSLDNEARRRRRAVSTDSDPSHEPKAPSQSEVLLKLAEDAECFHTPDQKAFATIHARTPGGEERGRVEHHPIRSSAFKEWLNYRFYRERGTSPSRETMETTLNTLEARARFDGVEESVHIRVAQSDGPEGLAYYVDLADKMGRAVRVTSDGWAVIDNPPVKFRRPKIMRHLPVPERGGNIEDLRPFVNVRSDTDTDWRLLVAVLCAYLRPTGPYPILAIQGEQGSAKSTTTRVVADLIDPSKFLRSMSREEHSLAIAANNSWVLTIDNLSGLPPWMSDALCRLATGACFATRTKYSDDDETIFTAMRPIVLNGIDDIAERPDLLDRSIVLNLPRITTDKRRTEQEFWRLFTDSAPKILGALLDAVSGGLKELPGVSPDRMLRMADFTCWGEAVGRGLGWGEDTFLDDFEQNQNSASASALEACPVASAVRKLMDFQSAWAGPAAQLLDRLKKIADDTTLRSKDWPKQPNALSNRLKRSAPTLRREGVEIEFGTSGKQRQIRIERRGPTRQCDSSSKPSTDDGKGRQHDLGADDHRRSASESTVSDRRYETAESATGSDRRQSSMTSTEGTLSNGPTGSEVGNSPQVPSDDADDVDDEFQEVSNEPGPSGEEEMKWEIS